MARALTGLSAASRGGRTLVGATAAILAFVSSAAAVEFLDGRVQIHGFAEMQIRALNSQFSQELDLAQWYNVINLEFEFDIAPDGFGPIDLLSAYVRVEGRYDALYSNGFGLFPSVNTFGNSSARIPERLRGAVDSDFGGVIEIPEARLGDCGADSACERSKDSTRVNGTQPQRIREPNSVFPAAQASLLLPDSPNATEGTKRPSPLRPFGERRGFPGFDTFFRQRGGDDVAGFNPDLNPVVDGQPLGRSDDPADYIYFNQTADGSSNILGPTGQIVGVIRNDNVFKFTFKDFAGNQAAGRTATMGPWLPKNFVQGFALTKSRANPFRGRFSPNVVVDRPILPHPGSLLDLTDVDYVPNPSGTRFYENDYDDALAAEIARDPNRRIDPLDPIVRTVAFAPDSVVTAFGDVLSEKSFPRFGSRIEKVSLRSTLLGSIFGGFGGDFSNIVPCGDSVTDGGVGDNQRTLKGENQFCMARSAEGGFIPGSIGQPIDPNGLVTVQENIKLIGGSLENPFRPAPDLSNLTGAENANNFVAQGLYLPNRGAVEELRSGRLNSLGSVFNIDQRHRSWNRGAAQRYWGELKEAYFDIEVMDSRLWMRLGLQNIVWGKTELFRTTDQFNPQDLALASLPSLEESRIGLWSARFVYSLYDVGPLEDVRAEFAFNFDHVQSADLGACGEPFTPDIVCSLTTGLWAHSALGIGVLGIDAPPDPWQDISGLEVGGRLEWRWDRFSFALTDFYGYNDFPYPDAIFFYERYVDPESGRPLVARSPTDAMGVFGQCSNPRTTSDQVGPNPLKGNARYNTTYASHPLSVTPTGAVATVPGAVLPPPLPPIPIVLPNFEQFRGGLGRDPKCLRPGGAPGDVNAFSRPGDPSRTTDSYIDPETGQEVIVPLEDTYALLHHHANQQIFTWVCSATTGIAASLDASSCAWTVFASPNPFTTVGGNQDRFSELLAGILAGENNGTGSQFFLQNIATSTKQPTTPSQVLRPVPLVSLNMLFNDPDNPLDLNANGVVEDATTGGCDGTNPDGPCDLEGFDGLDGRSLVLRQRMDAPWNEFVTLDKALTNEQRGLLGCGPFWGIRCDSSINGPVADTNNGTNGSLWYNQSGGLDFLNMEASVLLQSWPGIDGTLAGNQVVSTAPQPGTVGFVGGPNCTRFVETRGLVKLPGCRGVKNLWLVHDTSGTPVGVNVEFETGYLPQIDGCIIGHRIATDTYGTDPNATGKNSVPVNIVGTQDPKLAQQLEWCGSNATTRRAVSEEIPGPGGTTIPNPDCNGVSVGVGNFRVCDAETILLEDLPLIHPLAGCIASTVADPGGGCNSWYLRDLPDEFLEGTAQLFQNELAAFSWNFLVFLTITSCNFNSTDLDGDDHVKPAGAPDDAPVPLAVDRECFWPAQPYAPDRCSFNAPQFCSNVKGFLGAAGNSARTIRAGGNETYGRRTFIWHSGGSTVLRYQRRNVLGFSTDFAEDVTQTSWGVEFTWIDRNFFTDTNSPSTVTDSSTLNLTVSVDRPTFINFLNPNRTFFFNTQWFVNYIPGYRNSFTFNGPVNVLFTFAVFTGYFQDRLNPQFVSVYDFRSRSGGLLPSLQYRFTEAFSATIGINWFFGRTQLTDIPIRGFGPDTNQAGENAYTQGVDNLLSLIRRRDEIYLRLRWTF